MVIPAAMYIESAISQLGVRGVGGRSEAIRNDQCKELIAAVGNSRAADIGVTFPLSGDFQIGYALGLETARTIMKASTELILKGVDPEKVL